MRTIGEILKKARIEKKVELEEVEKDLKIRKKFLYALEQNDWSRLPSLPYIKGFIKNYSLYLGLIPDEMIAIFRRQYQDKDRVKILPTSLTSPISESIFRFTPKLTISFILFILLVFVFGYLIYQFRSYTNLPQLVIKKPLEGETLYDDKVIIAGKTDIDAVVSINNQKIALGLNGDFSTIITLPPGINTLLIESTSKSGKKKTILRTVQIQVKQ